MPKRIGLFGGSFDPIHFGHLISARAIAEQANLHKVVLIPSARPPHKTQVRLSSANDRLEMARLAIADDELFEVSDIEVKRDGPSYTFVTVSEYAKRVGSSDQLFWIIGGDSLGELQSWYRAAELVQLVQILTAARPGWRAPKVEDLALWAGMTAAERLLQHCFPTPEIQISATDIRQRVGDKKSIRFLTPEPVRSYIITNVLYSNADSKRDSLQPPATDDLIKQD